MKKIIFLSLCLFTIISCSTTYQPAAEKVSPPQINQPLAPKEITGPEKVGISSERLARIDQMCEEIVSDGNVPGMVVYVSRHGVPVLHKAYGMADVPSKRAMKTDDIFRIASQTKAITSTAVMMLWEEGLFQLDDPISKYIPAFAKTGVLDTYNEADSSFTIKAVERPITIRHLLTHTSGLGYGVIDGDPRFKAMYEKAGITDLFTTENITIEESVKKLANLPLHHNPGDKFTYSEGLDVLGYFIEIISGQGFDEFLRTRIFDPLDMDDTWFYLPEDKGTRLVSIHKKENDQWERFPVTFYDPDYPKKGARRFFSGGAGLSSTAADYAKFLQMYLNGGSANGHQLLSRTTVQSIMGNQIDDHWGDTGKYYGLAFGVVDQRGQDKGGLGSKGTFDWGGYFNTQYFADPVEQIIGVIMKQTRGPVDDESGWKFRQLVFQTVID